MRVESEVPRFEFEAVALGILSLAFYCLHLLNGSRLVGLNKVVEQFVYITHVRRHAMNEHIVGKCLVAQKLGYLAAQIDEALAYFKIVLAVVVRSLGVACHIQLLAQFALGAVGHERREAGIVECEEPSLLVSLFGCKGGSLAGRFRQTVELLLVSNVECESLVLLKQVVRELQRQHACLFSQLAQTLLALVVEQCTAAYESVVAVVEKHLLLGGKLAMVFVYVFDALKQASVELHVVGVLGQDRAEFLRQLVQFVACLGAEHAREYGRHA